VEQKEIAKKIQEGGVRAKLIIEIVGKPKEHIEETIKQISEKLKEEKKITKLNEKIHETKELQEKIFSTFAEVEIAFDTFQKFLDICYEYAPSSIEMLEPEKYTMKTKEIVGLLNDLISRAHNVTAQLREALAKIGILDNNFINLMKRMVVLMVESGPQKISYVSEKLGIPEDKAREFLKLFEKDGVIKVSGDSCELVKK